MKKIENLEFLLHYLNMQGSECKMQIVKCPFQLSHYGLDTSVCQERALIYVNAYLLVGIEVIFYLLIIKASALPREALSHEVS